MYQPGGYYPVNINDTFSNSRYCIVYKFGFGSYSTVWLTRDSHAEKYMVLKILVAATSKASTESLVLKYISQQSHSKSSNRSFINPILDEFETFGPNGRHLYLVTEPARCSLALSKEDPL